MTDEQKEFNAAIVKVLFSVADAFKVIQVVTQSLNRMFEVHQTVLRQLLAERDPNNPQIERLTESIATESVALAEVEELRKLHDLR